MTQAFFVARPEVPAGCRRAYKLPSVGWQNRERAAGLCSFDVLNCSVRNALNWHCLLGDSQSANVKPPGRRGETSRHPTPPPCQAPVTLNLPRRGARKSLLGFTLP